MLASQYLIPPESSVLASIGTEALVAARNVTTQEPAATVGRGATNGVNETGDFGGEALPESGVESCRTENETLPGSSEMKRHAGQMLSDLLAEAFARCS
jgi:hypothetical protein